MGPAAPLATGRGEFYYYDGHRMIERHDSVDESGVGIGTRVKRGGKSNDTSQLVSNPSGRGLRRQPYNLTNSVWPSEQAIDLDLQQQYVYGFEYVDEPVAQYEAKRS